MNNIPFLITLKDNFGADYTITDTSKITKLKAWNWLIKKGWHKCPNPQYLSNGEHFFYNNRLKPYLTFER